MLYQTREIVFYHFSKRRGRQDPQRSILWILQGVGRQWQEGVAVLFYLPCQLSSFFDFFSLLKLRGTPPPPPPLVDPPLVVEQFLECLLYLSITYYVDIRVIKSLSETTRLAFSLASRDVLTILIARPRLQTLKIRKSLYKRKSLLL